MTEIYLSWSNQDDSPDGTIAIERSSDDGSTWSDIATGIDPAKEFYVDSSVTSDNDYTYRIRRETDHVTATSGESNTALVRGVSVHGDGQATVTRGGLTKTRSPIVTGGGQITATRVLTKSRHPVVYGDGQATVSRSGLTKTRTSTTFGDGQSAVTRTTTKQRSPVVYSDGGITATRTLTKTRSSVVYGDGQIEATRATNKFRSTTIMGEASIESVQALRPVFPDQQALDVQWDFLPSLMAFGTEWLDESSIIKREVRDGLGVVLGGSLSTEIDVWIQYDTTGNGVPDVTSEKKPLDSAYYTLTFDNDSLFGEDGYYRVIVQGLRSGDTINQVDIGAVHNNL